MSNKSLAPYKAYKATSIPWIESIPSHWKEERAKWLFTRLQRVPDEKDDVVTCFRDGVVTLRKNRRTSGFTESLKEIGYQAVRKGELVIHAMDAFAGAIGVSDSDGKCTPVYSICKPSPNANSHYYAFIVREMARTGFILSLSKGIRERSTDFRFETFANQIIPLPPLDEQQKIVNFIQQQDRRIRRFIRNKQKLIWLLEEKYRLQSERLLTHGEPCASDYQIVEIDEPITIPAHWMAVPLVRCVTKRVDYRGATPTKTEEGVFLVTAKNVQKGKIDYEKSKEFVAAEQYDVIMRRGKPQINDLLFTTEAPLGNAALVDREDIALAQRIIKFTPDEAVIEPFFLLGSVLSGYFQDQLKRRATGSTAQGIKASKLPQLMILLPPKDEQGRLVKKLRLLIASFEFTKGKISREIALLKEYRSRLIADAVTGKIDLRSVPLEQTDETIEEELFNISSNGFDADTETEVEDEELLEEAAHAN